MIRWLWVIGMVGLLSACASVSRFEKNEMTAHGERLDGSSQILYYALSMELAPAGAASAALSGVRLKLDSEAPALPLSVLTSAFVARYLPRFVPPPQWPAPWKARASKDEAYEGGGFYIRFIEGRLASIGLCSHCSGGRHAPEIGPPDGSRLYALPLTESELVDVFGPPDRVRHVQQVTY